MSMRRTPTANGRANKRWPGETESGLKKVATWAERTGRGVELSTRRQREA